LRTSEEKFFTMFQAAPIAIALSSLPEGWLHDVNPAWLKLNGFQGKEEVLGKTSLELGLIPEPQRRDAILEEFRNNGLVRNAELRTTTRSGGQRDLSVNLDRVQIGGEEFILSIMEDVTARTRAEQELRRHRDQLNALVKARTTELETRNAQLVEEARERVKVEAELLQSEQRYRAVVDDQTELICRYRPDGSYLFVNPAWCRFYGKRPDEVLGTSWHPNSLPEDVPMIQRKLNQLSPEHPSVVVECRVASGTGELHWMQFVNHGVFDPEGRLTEGQAVGHDITQLKEAEQALKRYAQRLVRQEEELRKKVSMELHDDIGQELTALDFNLTYLGRNLPARTAKKLVELLEDSRSLARDINRTVRNLMGELRPSQLDIYGLEGAILSYVRHFKTRTGLTVDLHIPPDFPRIQPEEEITLFRILQEALTNVGKYAEAARVTVSLERSDQRVRLSVVDDGKGFRPRRPAPSALGSGWGLTIMRERAEMIGGSFKVESRQGGGTSIVVELPVREQAGE